MDEYYKIISSNNYVLERKINGYHSFFYVLKEPLKIPTTDPIKYIKEIDFTNENLYEGEYVNGKYYIYSIISSRDDTYLNINYKDNVELYLKEIENHLSFDFIKK